MKKPPREAALFLTAYLVVVLPEVVAPVEPLVPELLLVPDEDG